MLSGEAIVTFIFTSTLLSLSPGPDNIFVLIQSALYGRRAGVLVTLGLCTGLIAHTSAVALGVAAIFQTSALAFSLLKVAGAIYLAYLAWQAFSAGKMSLDTENQPQRSHVALYRRGIIMNITNPKVSIFFLAFLPQFTNPVNGSLMGQVFILGTLFIITALVIFTGLAVLAGLLRHWLSHSARAQTYLNRIAGTVFAGLALHLLTSSPILQD